MYVQEIMEEGMILNPYLKWLEEQYDKGKLLKWLSKPLGLCVYCQSFWLHLVFYFVLYGHGFLHFLLTLGGVFISIEIIRRIKGE